MDQEMPRGRAFRASGATIATNSPGTQVRFIPREFQRLPSLEPRTARRVSIRGTRLAFVVGWREPNTRTALTMGEVVQRFGCYFLAGPASRAGPRRWLARTSRSARGTYLGLSLAAQAPMQAAHFDSTRRKRTITVARNKEPQVALVPRLAAAGEVGTNEIRIRGAAVAFRFRRLASSVTRAARPRERWHGGPGGSFSAPILFRRRGRVKQYRNSIH